MRLKEGQRVVVSAAEGWDTAAIRGGGTLDLVGAELFGTVSDVGGMLALVTLDGGLTIVVDRKRDPRVRPVNSVTLDLGTWPRLAEVEAFAAERGITLRAAVELLVNSGLSHR